MGKCYVTTFRSLQPNLVMSAVELVMLPIHYYRVIHKLIDTDQKCIEDFKTNLVAIFVFVERHQPFALLLSWGPAGSF